MSYCRFSSDDFKSDFYIFRSSKYEVLVAANRINWEFRESMTYDEYVEELRHSIMEDRLPRDVIPIELPYAGEARAFDTPGEAADWAEHVATFGYHLPEKAIIRLRTEQAELDSDRPN